MMVTRLAAAGEAIVSKSQPRHLFAVASIVAITLSCGGATTSMAHPPVSATPAGAQETQDRQTVSGRFSVITGDPPPDSGQKPQRRYVLTESSGRRWALSFDESVYTPPGGVLSFNGKDVDVSGRVTGTDRLLVESIRLR
jgi:hypothetical protein